MGDFIEEEEEDLYSDLPNFKYDETVDKLKADNKELQGRVVFLEDVLEKQSKELEGIRSQCETLTKNISSLLKTAQNEIKRKDNKINELNKMVLELKTEILTLKKRKNDCMTPINNEEPAFKQQKLENTSSVKSVSPQFFCNPEIIEKSNNQEESGESKINLPEKEYAPDIKCHTLYSKRMYNKIYNVGTQDCNRKSANIDTKNDDVFLENNVKANMNTKLEDKSMSRPKPKTQKERVSDKQLDHPTFNLQEKEAIVDSLKNSNNGLRGMNAKELFNVIRNESSTLYNKNAGLEPTQLTNQDEKQIVLVPGSKSIQLNKEMSTHCSGTSPKREKSSSDYFNNETGKNNNCAQENVISRMNSSTSFSTTENFSKDVYIKHYTKNSKICTVVNKDKVYNVDNSKKIEKTDISSDKMQGHCNEKFAKSYCLKKSKKSIKSLICPISGEWAKNTEAVPPNNLVTMDANKRNSPNGKTEKEDLDIMESLFGSPLKWTENSVDDGKQVEKLSPPATAFEDSCSAHIENLKFKETRNNVTEVSETKITELSLTKKFSYTERKCYFQPSGTEVDHKLPKFDSENKSEVSLSKDIHKQSIITHWPFKKTNNDIPTKNRSVTSPTFSSFVSTESTSEACDVPPSLKSNPNSLDLVNSSTKFLTSPKYNDSVLGQFDDTTQLISALAKDPSKLSPIHTPIKETKPDSTGAKTQYQLAENRSAKPLTIPIDDKNGSVTTDIEEKKKICKEPTSSVAENKTLPVSKASLTNRKTSKNPTVDKKPSVTKPLIPTFEKKLSIPASVISSVEKKLSFPFSVLSPVEKKIEKKTILLEQPINILCPRKTPRQISSCKQNVLSKNQNTVKDIIKNSQDELNFIKSPPFKQKQSKTEPQSTQELTTVGSNKNLEDDGRDLKNRDTVNIVSSNSEGDRKSKSPTNIFSKNKRAMSKNNFVSEDKTTISVRTLFKNDRSPVKDKIKHSHSRKENVPERREKKSPMKEKSPLKFKRDQRLVGRDSKIEIFKHPLHRRESFKRPNCHFRQSSVERKIAKDWRYSGKTRSLPVKAGNVSESSRTINCKVSKSNFNTKINDSKERHSLCYPNKTPVISRSSKISWSSSTGVVSTKPSKVQSYSEFSITPPTEMKWILRPIDFDVSSSNGLKESNIKSGSETSSITLVSNSKTEAETPVSKFFQATDSSIISPEKSSPGKSIVIVAERRPIKFGSNN